MELKEYVKQTLLSITDAIEEAQQTSKLHIALHKFNNEDKSDQSHVRFEISVTTGGEAGGGIRVLSLGDAKASGKIENQNRLTFEVPVYFQAPTTNSRRYIYHPEHISESEKSGKAAASDD